MARPSQEAIDMFVSITGASEAVALLKLEEHRGDLNEAVNAYFEGDGNRMHMTSDPVAQNDFMNIDDPIPFATQGPLSLLSAARNFNPFSILDSHFGRSLFDSRGASAANNQAPQVSLPREVRQIPIEFKDGDDQSRSRPIIEDVTGITDEHGPEVYGTVVSDDDDYGDDIEEEMVKAAIEASKMEAEEDSNSSYLEQRILHAEDIDVAPTASQSLKDDEYLAALLADKEKEAKAREEAEIHLLQEASSKEAVLQEKKHQVEEARQKILEQEEYERLLAAKKISFPQEPDIDDENALTLLVRMPDGSRHGRRFLKTDNLQSLFDFIDIGRWAKPGTYRLVRPYPRRAFCVSEGGLTFSDLGLTSKQEALFLELV